MLIDDHHYDFIVIGGGASGATLAHQLSKKGKWVLLLERGGPVSYTHLTLPTKNEV